MGAKCWMRVSEAWTMTKNNNKKNNQKKPKKKTLRFYPRAQKFTDHKTLLSQCVGLCFKNSKSKAFVLQHENKTEMYKAKLKIFILLCPTNWGSWYTERSSPFFSTWTHTPVTTESILINTQRLPSLPCCLFLPPSLSPSPCPFLPSFSFSSVNEISLHTLLRNLSNLIRTSL